MSDEFWVSMFAKIQHNSEHLGIGWNLETRIIKIHSKHRNSPEQSKI